MLRCTRVPRLLPAPPAAPAPDPLVGLEHLARRLEEAVTFQEVQRQALDTLDDLFGFRFTVLFAPDAVTGRLVATAASGAAQPVLGVEADPATGLIGTAASRRRVVLVNNLARVRALAGDAATDIGSGIGISGRPGSRSAAAVPLIVGRRLLGVLYLESRQPYAFAGPVETLLRIIGAHTAAALAARGASGTGTKRAPARVTAPDAGPPMEIVRYRADDTVLCDSTYIVRGAPARILWSMLEAHVVSGRTRFTNRELRLDPSLKLPVGNDNLEARLLVLRRRLAELGCGITLERVGRGRIELRLDRPAELTVVPTVGPCAAPAFPAKRLPRVPLGTFEGTAPARPETVRPWVDGTDVRRRGAACCWSLRYRSGCWSGRARRQPAPGWTDGRVRRRGRTAARPRSRGSRPRAAPLGAGRRGRPAAAGRRGRPAAWWRRPRRGAHARPAARRRTVLRAGGVRAPARLSA